MWRRWVRGIQKFWKEIWKASTAVKTHWSRFSHSSRSKVDVTHLTQYDSWDADLFSMWFSVFIIGPVIRTCHRHSRVCLSVCYTTHAGMKSGGTDGKEIVPEWRRRSQAGVLSAEAGKKKKTGLLTLNCWQNGTWFSLVTLWCGSLFFRRDSEKMCIPCRHLFFFIYDF